MSIAPIPDGAFLLRTELEAERLAQSDPAALTDVHLMHLAAVDAAFAERAAAARTAALEPLAANAAHGPYLIAPARETPAQMHYRSMPAPAAADVHERTSTSPALEAVEQMLALHDELHGFVRQIDDRNKTRNGRLDTLEQTVLRLIDVVRELATTHGSQTARAALDALERRPHLAYRGEWQPEQQYAPGDAVTQHGMLWICQRDGAGEPGIGLHAGWRLPMARSEGTP